MPVRARMAWRGRRESRSFTTGMEPYLLACRKLVAAILAFLAVAVAVSCNALTGRRADCSGNFRNTNREYEKLTGHSLRECPVCHHGRMITVKSLAKDRSPPDTSDRAAKRIFSFAISTGHCLDQRRWQGSLTCSDLLRASCHDPAARVIWLGSRRFAALSSPHKTGKHSELLISSVPSGQGTASLPSADL
jgi:hypothetical protein